MAKVLYVHPDNPQPRLLSEAVESLRDGGIIIYPTDTSYALACKMGDKTAVERLAKIRGLGGKQHFFTLACHDLSDLGRYAKVDNTAFRLLKELTPGPFTFLLNASKEVPRLLLNPKRKVIGLRIPDHKTAQMLIETMGEPILSTSLLLPDEKIVLSDPQDIYNAWDRQVDLIVDSGFCGDERTTIIDLHDDNPQILRQGKGIVSGF